MSAPQVLRFVNVTGHQSDGSVTIAAATPKGSIRLIHLSRQEAMRVLATASFAVYASEKRLR